MITYKEVLHQTLAVTPVCFDEFAMGIGYGWLAPTLRHLQNSTIEGFSLTTEECSWIASLHSFGRAIGPILSAFLVDVVGRKAILILHAVVVFLMWLLLMLSKSIFIIYTVRIVFGLALGMYEVTNTIYIGELCTPKLRGLLGSLTATCFYAGVFVEFIVATYLSYETVTIINASVGLACLMSIVWLREPAQFLLMKKKENQALKNLMWLKGTKNPNEIKTEFEKMKHNVYSEKLKKFSFKAVFLSKANFRSIMIVLVIYLITGLSGYEAISAFASIAFSSSEMLTENEFTIILGLLNLFAVGIMSCLMERINRRSLFLVSFALSTIVLVATAVLYYVQDNITDIPQFSWLIFGTITAYMTIYAAVYPAIYIIRGELFPLSVKAIGGCLCIIGNSLIGFIITRIFLILSEWAGMYLNFVLFAIFSLITVFYVYYSLPETRGRTLIEIQEELEK